MYNIAYVRPEAFIAYYTPIGMQVNVLLNELKLLLGADCADIKVDWTYNAIAIKFTKRQSDKTLYTLKNWLNPSLWGNRSGYCSYNESRTILVIGFALFKMQIFIPYERVL